MNKIGPALAPYPQDESLSTNLPPDEQDLFIALRDRIVSIFTDIPHMTEYVKVHGRERFPATDQEDIAIATLPDPLVQDVNRTGIIQLGIPSVDEMQGTSDLDTSLIFTYPITMDLEAVDLWNDTKGVLHYTNTADLAMSIYMTARRSFKNRRTLGFRRCETMYLQQLNAPTVITDEDTGGRSHSIDWSLTVKVGGILV